ncbi:MAG: SpoIID/LytB domain-containing protein [Patescibacteria group bacterium]
MKRVRFYQRLVMVAGAVLLFGGSLLPCPNVLAGSAYAAKWINQLEGVSLKQGESTEVWVDIQNTGTAAWLNNGNQAVKIATINPRDRQSNFYHSSWLSENRIASAVAEQVAPGETGHFVFQITAGGPAGKYREYFSLVAENVAWFDEFKFYVEVNILPVKFAGTLVETPPAIVLKTGESKTVSVKVTNNSEIAWSNAGAQAVKLGTAGLYDRSSSFYNTTWLSANRVAVAAAPTAVGGTATFDFTIAAPNKTGVYQEKFSLVAEGMAWIDSTQFTLAITVQPAIYKMSWVNQSESSIVTPGEETTIWVDLRNDGNTVWPITGDRAVKLGTARTLDRASDFYSSTWLSPNRAAVSDKVVNPGEIGRFSFTIKAPDQIGQHKEYFRLVAEQVTWFTDIGIYWDITVSEELVLKNPIQVGLSSTTTNISIQSNNGMVVRRGTDKTLVVRINAGTSATVTPRSGGYIINVGGAVYDVSDWVRFIPLRNSIIEVTNEKVSNQYDRFRGVVTIRRSSWSNNVWMVNELELEDYLKGLAEVPDSWPLEARKAQVVAARTFAARRMRDSRADIFHLYDDTRDQVYYGYTYEINRPGIAEAVAATPGVIITYNGEPISAYYFSDSGGSTENVENAWSNGNPAKALPYLKGVSDPYAKPITWEATLSQSYLRDVFGGTLNKIGAVSETITDLLINERYPSGRLKTLTIVTSTGKQTSISTATFEALIDTGYVKSANLTITKSGMDYAPTFLATGKGWGHGVGLPQWSAYNMASQGQTYDQILKYFYTGVNVGVS